MIKTFACIVIGLIVSYLTLGLVAENLSAVSMAACSDAFTLPALACRFAGLGVTLILVPLAGVIAFLASRQLLKKNK